MIFLVVLLLWNGNETAHATQGKQILEDIREKNVQLIKRPAGNCHISPMEVH